HVGHLWTNAGGQLAEATFTSESGSGWQQVTLASPVAVTANTTYVASYVSPTGRYSYTPAAFAASGYVHGPLRAIADGGIDGANGVFIQGQGFPTQTFNSTNYWVDVVFATTPPPISAVQATD